MLFVVLSCYEYFVIKIFLIYNIHYLWSDLCLIIAILPLYHLLLHFISLIVQTSSLEYFPITRLIVPGFERYFRLAFR